MGIYKSDSSPVFGEPHWVCEECGTYIERESEIFNGSLRLRHKGHKANCKYIQESLKEAIKVSYWIRHKMVFVSKRDKFLARFKKAL